MINIKNSRISNRGVVFFQFLEQDHIELLRLVLDNTDILSLAENLYIVRLTVLVTEPKNAPRLQQATVQFEMFDAVDVLWPRFRHLAHGLLLFGAADILLGDLLEAALNITLQLAIERTH
jgi:hypothetical protein